jgi:hypothetical protein
MRRPFWKKTMGKTRFAIFAAVLAGTWLMSGTAAARELEVPTNLREIAPVDPGRNPGGSGQLRHGDGKRSSTHRGRGRGLQKPPPAETGKPAPGRPPEPGTAGRGAGDGPHASPDDPEGGAGGLRNSGRGNNKGGRGR